MKHSWKGSTLGVALCLVMGAALSHLTMRAGDTQRITAASGDWIDVRDFSGRLLSTTGRIDLAAKKRPTATLTAVADSRYCSADVHAQYVTSGPDGQTYPTWHPQRDPSGCYFGHEHGSDPALIGDGFRPLFGYVNAVAGHPETHHGYKHHVIVDGLGNTWSIMFHMGTSSVGAGSRFCNPLHAVQFHVLSGSGRLLADTSVIGHFGAAVHNQTQQPFTPDACPTQGHDDRTGPAGRQMGIAPPNGSGSGYEPWTIDFGNMVPGLGSHMVVNMHSNGLPAATVCVDLRCNEVVPTGGGGALAKGAKRHVTFNSGNRIVGHPNGTFYTDPHGHFVDASAPNAIKQYVRPGLDRSIPTGQWFIVEMPSGRFGPKAEQVNDATTNVDAMLMLPN